MHAADFVQNRLRFTSSKDRDSNSNRTIVSMDYLKLNNSSAPYKVNKQEFKNEL